MTSPTSRSVILLLALLAAARDSRAGEPVRVAGTGGAVAAMTRLAVEAAIQDPSLAVRVLPSLGSTGAIKALADGALDLAIIARPLRATERALGIAGWKLARSPLLFAVGPGVEASDLTTDDLVAIYLGTRLTWPDGQRLRLVLRQDTDADTGILRTLSPGMSAAVEAAGRRPGMLVAVSNTECNEILARMPGALGPSSLIQLRSELRPLRALRLNGVEPTLENLESGRYPLEKPLHVAFRSPAPEGVRKFVAFLASPRARALLRELGALSLDVPPPR